MPGEPFRAWLFQANPRYYDLAAGLAGARAGDEDDWPVSRYHGEMQAGDAVALWKCGPLAGVHALAELAGDPYLSGQSYPPEAIETHPYLRSAWWVRLRLVQVFGRPLPRGVLQMHPVLGGLSVLRAPRGTVFRVTPAQWEALVALVGD